MNDGADDDRGAVEHLLDVFVYLPVGLVLDLRRLAPQLIERGRRELEAGRDLTRYALRPRGVPAVGQLQEHAVGTLRALGIVPAPAPAGPISPAATVDRARADGSGPSRTGASGQVVPPATASGVAAVPTRSSPTIDVETLAIPDYDSLSASQVVPRLESLQADELELIRQYELEGRGRKTILSKIAQLQGG